MKKIRGECVPNCFTSILPFVPSGRHPCTKWRMNCTIASLSIAKFEESSAINTGEQALRCPCLAENHKNLSKLAPAQCGSPSSSTGNGLHIRLPVSRALWTGPHSRNSVATRSPGLPAKPRSTTLSHNHCFASQWRIKPAQSNFRRSSADTFHPAQHRIHGVFPSLQLQPVVSFFGYFLFGQASNLTCIFHGAPGGTRPLGRNTPEIFCSLGVFKQKRGNIAHANAHLRRVRRLN